MKGCHWLAVAVVPTQDNQTTSLEFQDALVTVILQALADYRQLNLITAAGVDGNLTLRLDNVPWLQALALVLRMGNLSMTRESSVMMVSADGCAGKTAASADIGAATAAVQCDTGIENADAAEIAESLSAQRACLTG